MTRSGGQNPLETATVPRTRRDDTTTAAASQQRADAPGAANSRRSGRGLCSDWRVSGRVRLRIGVDVNAETVGYGSYRGGGHDGCGAVWCCLEMRLDGPIGCLAGVYRVVHEFVVAAQGLVAGSSGSASGVSEYLQLTQIDESFKPGCPARVSRHLPVASGRRRPQGRHLARREAAVPLRRSLPSR